MAEELNIYENLQQEPVAIGQYCVVEVYRDSISTSTAQGYFIQPLEGLVNPKEAIEARVRKVANSGSRKNLVILAGRTYDSYNRRIVYAVWYNGTTVPTYPAKPTEPEYGDVGEGLSYFESHKFTNNGIPTDCSITLSIVRTDIPVEFYLNDDYFKVDLAGYALTGKQEVVVDKTGVYYNSRPVDTFELIAVPTLKSGENEIRCSQLAVQNVKIDYQTKF